jgi:hypothetical protein
MRPPPPNGRLVPWALALLLSSAGVAAAQDLVPGAYTPAPVGINVVTLATVFNGGSIAFDPSLPIEDASADIGAMVFGVNRTLGIAGRYANVGVGMPFLVGHLEGQVLGQFQEADRRGFGDLGARVAINLHGAPAMTRQQFASYRPRTIVGLSFVVGVPVGQYDSARYINLGSNRWSFRPELGISRTVGKWTFEGDIGGMFFTDNTNYVNGATRKQAPIVAFQAHLIRIFRPGLWVAGDGNFWRGGRVTTTGAPALLEQKNSRLGITLAVPIRRQQVRVAYSFGAYTTIGGDYHSIGLSYSYAWARRPAATP